MNSRESMQENRQSTMRIRLRSRSTVRATAAAFLAAALLLLPWFLPTVVVLRVVPWVDGFHMVMMARRGKGNLKRSLEDSDNVRSKVASLNQGKGQEITGVTLPPEVSGNECRFYSWMIHCTLLD